MEQVELSTNNVTVVLQQKYTAPAQCGAAAASADCLVLAKRAPVRSYEAAGATPTMIGYVLRWARALIASNRPQPGLECASHKVVAGSADEGARRSPGDLFARRERRNRAKSKRSFPRAPHVALACALWARNGLSSSDATGAANPDSGGRTIVAMSFLGWNWVRLRH